MWKRLGETLSEASVVAEPAEAEAVRAVVTAFLSGFGVGGQHQALLVDRLVVEAAAGRRDRPGESFAACALEHAEQQFETWLGQVLGPDVLDGQPALTIGLAAFLACGGPTAWPELLLVDDDLPEPFVAAMRAAAPLSSPVPMPGSMAAQSLECWSIADAVRSLAELLDTTQARLAGGRQLITASIRPDRPTS
jgi:hypothetical protein